eukprot:3766342-Pyramimonas_sp.AAC.1
MLFVFEADHHKCKNGHSQRWQELSDLCDMINHSWKDDKWTHFCHDPATGRPCCRNQNDTIDKTTRAVYNALLGHSGRVPTESRWTNTLSAMQQTVLRCLFHRVGVDAFCMDCDIGDLDDDEIGNVTVEAEASENFFKISNRARSKKTREYFESHCELVVYVVLFDTGDRNLLYPVMEDVIHNDCDKPSKMDGLLKPGDGRIVL